MRKEFIENTEKQPEKVAAMKDNTEKTRSEDDYAAGWIRLVEHPNKMAKLLNRKREERNCTRKAVVFPWWSGIFPHQGFGRQELPYRPGSWQHIKYQRWFMRKLFRYFPDLFVCLCGNGVIISRAHRLLYNVLCFRTPLMLKVYNKINCD